MHRWARPFFVCCALNLAGSQALAQVGAPPQASSEEAVPSAEREPSTVPTSTDKLCATLVQAAANNALPVDFFVRVIWQESRFNAAAVSPKGAQGIAQFMPKTADWRGLSNPFDVNEALVAAASYLHDLHKRFGNLGLAAAAYNAGPGRVDNWLSARTGLPKETRRYVEIVTGHSAEEWTSRNTGAQLSLPETVACSDAVKSFDYRMAAKPEAPGEKLSQSNSVQLKPGWGVQLIGSPSRASALTSFQQLQRAYKRILEARQPLIVESKVGTSGFWYRVRIATDSRVEADKLCSGLRAAGGSCLVQRN
jgi:hypothetical protein